MKLVLTGIFSLCTMLAIGCSSCPTSDCGSCCGSEECGTPACEKTEQCCGSCSN